MGSNYLKNQQRSTWNASSVLATTNFSHSVFLWHLHFWKYVFRMICDVIIIAIHQIFVSNHHSVLDMFKYHPRVTDVTWKLRWAAPPSGPLPGPGCGSEISWGPRPAPCPGSPFHLPHSWYTGRGREEKLNTNMAQKHLCSAPIL